MGVGSGVIARRLRTKEGRRPGKVEALDRQMMDWAQVDDRVADVIVDNWYEVKGAVE